MLKMIRNVYDCQEWGMLAILAFVAMAGCNAQQIDSPREVDEQVFKQEVVFSEVRGQLLDQGKPVVGATIRRGYSHDRDDKDHFDQTTTDKHGLFSFPEVSLPKKLRGLFSEFGVSQSLELLGEGEPIRLWQCYKDNPDQYAEYGFEKADLICDPSNEYQRYRFDSGLVRIVTRCRIEPINSKESR